MGVDIYIKAGKNDFFCRLYWITGLVDRYSYEYDKDLPEFTPEKRLNKQQIWELLDFLEFVLTRLHEDKKKSLDKFDSQYFIKTDLIYQKLRILIPLLKEKQQIDKRTFPQLQGIIRRLEGFYDAYYEDPIVQKAEITEDYDEKINLVEKIIPLLNSVLITKGFVAIG